MRIYLGDSYPIRGTFKDSGGVLFDPDTHTITLLDSTKKQVETQTTPDRDSLGTFTTAFDIPITGRRGVWEISWTISKDGLIDTERHRFKVRPVQ